MRDEGAFVTAFNHIGSHYWHMFACTVDCTHILHWRFRIWVESSDRSNGIRRPFRTIKLTHCVGMHMHACTHRINRCTVWVETLSGGEKWDIISNLEFKVKLAWCDDSYMHHNIIQSINCTDICKVVRPDRRHRMRCHFQMHSRITVWVVKTVTTFTVW